MNMKQAIFSLVFLLAATWAHAQLTLDECQRGAQANYPSFFGTIGLPDLE